MVFHNKKWIHPDGQCNPFCIRIAQAISGGFKIEVGMSRDDTSTQSWQGRPLPLMYDNKGTKLDLDAYIERLRIDPVLRSHFYAFSDTQFAKFVNEYYMPTMREEDDTKVHLTRPSTTDVTIRYTHIPSTFGLPTITIRWWVDRFGYCFDIIKPKNKQDYSRTPVHPPNLTIHYQQSGCWSELLPINLPGAPQNGVGDPPLWIAQPGDRLRFLSKDDGRILGEVFAPRAPCEYPQYDSFRELEDAMSTSN